MIELGFAIPRLQVEIPRLAEPGRCHRVDFLWTRRDASGVIGEFDGMGKYEDPGMLRGRSPIRALAEEQHREAELSLYGMPIVRMSYKDVMDRDRLCRLLSTYGIPRNEKAPELERRLFPRGVTGAFEFSVAGVPDCLGQVA